MDVGDDSMSVRNTLMNIGNHGASADKLVANGGYNIVCMFGIMPDAGDDGTGFGDGHVSVYCQFRLRGAQREAAAVQRRQHLH